MITTHIAVKTDEDGSVVMGWWYPGEDFMFPMGWWPPGTKLAFIREACEKEWPGVKVSANPGLSLKREVSDAKVEEAIGEQKTLRRLMRDVMKAEADGNSLH